jgi:hypothetical protein
MCGRTASFDTVLVAMDRADKHSRRHPRHVVRVTVVRPEGWPGREELMRRIAL